MASPNTGKRKDREDDLIDDEGASSKMRATSSSSDDDDDDSGNWADAYEQELYTFMQADVEVGELKRYSQAFLDPNFSMTPDAGTLEMAKAMLKSSGGDNKYLKMLVRQIESTVNPDDKGTKIKGKLAPRMVSWAESRKGMRQTTEYAMHTFFDSMKGEPRSSVSAPWLSRYTKYSMPLGSYLFSQICDLLHGDVSLANMYRYFGQNGKMVGVLNDFDHHEMTRTEYYSDMKKNREDVKKEESECATSLQLEVS